MKPLLNERFFKPVLEYNNAHIDIIEKICEPLKVFGITGFGYLRVFDKGRYISVANWPTYHEAFLCYDYYFNTQFWKTQPRLFSKYETCPIIWPDHGNDDLLAQWHSGEVYNGVNVIKENQGSYECYFFGADKDVPLVKNVYRDRFFVLEQFIAYFHTVAGDLIDPASSTRQGFSPYLRETYPCILDIFEKDTPWEKEVVAFNNLLQSKVQEEILATGKTYSLTSREIQCLSHLSTGRTAKEIARILKITPRTVETHINKLRIKTSCQNKRELTCWFEDTFQRFLTKEIHFPQKNHS